MNWSIVNAPDLSDQQFSEWKQLLEDRVGIRVGDSQKQFLQSQVSMRMREIGEEDFSLYLDRLKDGVEGKLEWAILLDRLVVKETSFFRHQPSYDFVCAYLQNKINNQSLDEPFEVWSLGCSTGEEPYSLAMLINEIFELAKLEPYFGITGTDVSRMAISRAREAVFSQKKIEFVPVALRYKYFKSLEKQQFRFDHDVAGKICFSNNNIMNLEKMPPQKFDLVYCQNLLVYFAQATRKALLDSVVEKLKAGAILILGLGEVTNWKNAKVERLARADVQAYVRV
jgi:chemotaxis methyl-accepting protein methylase